MSRLGGVSIALLLVLAALLLPSEAQSAKKADADAIKVVMKEAHKDGLLKKVLGDKASDEEKAKLLDHYVTLFEAPCPGGDGNSWTQKTADLVVSAARVVVGREGALGELKETSSCGGCHKAHKIAKKKERKRIRIDASSIVGLAPKVAGAAATLAEPKHDIKKLMKEAHKDGLLKKIRGGDASQEEKLHLLDLYISMYDFKPTKGDMNSWRQKAGASVAAAAKAVLGKEDAPDALKKATSCGGCHKVHK